MHQVKGKGQGPKEKKMGVGKEGGEGGYASFTDTLGKLSAEFGTHPAKKTR